MMTVKLFYRPEQNVTDNQSFSPSAGKPTKVLESWLKLQDESFTIDVQNFEPLTPEQISLAHCPVYVRGVLACEVSNGFGNRLPSVAASLPYTTGSLAAAALHSFKTCLRNIVLQRLDEQLISPLVRG